MTSQQVEDNILALFARVSQLDGIGMSQPAGASIPKLQAGLNGQTETLTQVTLTLEAHLNEIELAVAELRSLLQAHLSGS